MKCAHMGVTPPYIPNHTARASGSTTDGSLWPCPACSHRRPQRVQGDQGIRHATDQSVPSSWLLEDWPKGMVKCSFGTVLWDDGLQPQPDINVVLAEEAMLILMDGVGQTNGVH